MPSFNEQFTIQLAGWQTRMAKDFLKKTFTKATIKPGHIQCPASNKIPIDGLLRGDWILYLTDEQMQIIKERFNLDAPISGINVTSALILQKSIIFS